MTAETDLELPGHNGKQEIAFSLDPDGDMYVEINTARGDGKQTIYLRAEHVRQLRDWLTKVAL